VGNSKVFVVLARTLAVAAPVLFPKEWAEPVAIWLSVGAIVACGWAHSPQARVAGACCAAATFGWFWMGTDSIGVYLFAGTALFLLTCIPRSIPHASSTPA
jgi:hypothetical protein